MSSELQIRSLPLTRGNPTSEDSARGITSKEGGFVMAHLIMGHGVSGCFGTSLAPILCLYVSLNERHSVSEHFFALKG